MMTTRTQTNRRHALTTLALAALAISAVAPNAMAQGAFPNKPITLVVTYPPGGGADAMARLIAPKMGEALGQSVVIENKPGASGQIGAQAVAKATPDGYTLMLDASSFSANPALYPKLPYDSLKAFKPIGVVALFPNVVLVNANFPAKNIAELTAAARKSKDAVSYASSGNGSAQHLAGALFESAAKVDMVHVPYKGGGPALNDVIGGQVPLFFGRGAHTCRGRIERRRNLRMECGVCPRQYPRACGGQTGCCISTSTGVTRSQSPCGTAGWRHSKGFAR
jgi:tripartite-type tricarboxylate transporter receptor subunit TctC